MKETKDIKSVLKDGKKELINPWHLAQTDKEVQITECELQLWRVFHGFLRWQEECEKACNNNALTGQDLSVLHVIRMKERPKSVADIARILNRKDTFNIKYSIKKLSELGLIEKTKGSIKKNATYQITDEGIKNTDIFVKARKNLLIRRFIKENDLNLQQLIKDLGKMIDIYDEAGRYAVSYMID